MVFRRATLVACVFLSVAAGAADAGLINGTFADPDLGWAPYKDYYVGDTMPGWTIEAGNIDVQRAGFLGVPGDVGTQYVDMNGNRAGTISQVMQAVAGATYALSFDYGGGIDPGYGDSTGNSLYYQMFDASSGKTLLQGSVLIRQANLDTWTTLGGLQAATTSSQLGVRFWSDGQGADSFFGPYLDGVGVTLVVGAAVPEPSSLGLVAIGGLISLACRRRGRR